MADTHAARPGSAARSGLVGLGIFGGGGITLSAVYATTGWGLPCPFLALTGWACPFCGGTRLGAALLRADLPAAFAANPAVLVILVLLGGLGLVWLVEASGGPVLRLSTPSRTLRRWLTPWRALVLALLAAAVYTLARHMS